MTRRIHDGPKYIYFIRPVGMDGPIKIGCSSKPAERLQVLSSWSPFVLELIGTVPGGFDDEKRLHHRFSDLHTRREWFMSSPVLRETIRLILAGTPVIDACKDLEFKGTIKKNRPLKTPDRELFLRYGHRVRKATRHLHNKQGSYYAPENIKQIMHDWRCDRINGHEPIVPTPEQLALLDAFIADPLPQCVFREWGWPRSKENSTLEVAA